MKKYILCAAASLCIVTALSAQSTPKKDTVKKEWPKIPNRKDSLPTKDTIPVKKDTMRLQPIAVPKQ